VAQGTPAGLKSYLAGQMMGRSSTARAMPEAAVEVRELSKSFGAFKAVDGVSFSISKGEIFGFVGPNGAGKSTTIRMLTGLLPPTSGIGRVAGFDTAREMDQVKARIGYMSQRFSLYDDLTVAENIDFYAGVYGVTGKRLRQRKQWILGMAGLTERENSLTRDLSAGWKQRLALGTALVHEPEILFLDEPTSGVDPASRRSFWELIHQLAADGVAVLVTTHSMDEAEQCDRLALIYKGKLVAIGPPAELKRHHGGATLLEAEAAPSLEDVFVSLVEQIDRKSGESQA
jgi:ABC-2 type transport system ATP-binding protein